MIVIDIDFTTKQVSATATNDITLGSGGGGESFSCSQLNDCTTIQQLVADKHTHANKSILDNIQEAFTTALKSAYDGSVTSLTALLNTGSRLITDGEITKLSNTSGTNTGDNATNSQYSGLATSKQDTLVSGTNIKTINNVSILGSGNISVPQAQNKFYYCYKTPQSITGVTGVHNFNLGACLIPANTVSANDCIQFLLNFSKYNTGTAQFGVAICPVIGNPAQGVGAQQIAGSAATGNNNSMLVVERKSLKATASGLIVPNILYQLNDYTAINPILLTGINWSVDNYITPFCYNVSATTVDARLDFIEVIIK